MKHPVEKFLERASEKDRKIARELYEAGFDDEDLYAALPTPITDKLLRQVKKPKKKQWRNDYE